MAAAHRGDARMYECLLRELGGAIDAYLRARFGALSFREDCVQECLLAIHAGRHTYDPRRPFRPWLFTIVQNKTIDLLRRSYAAPETLDGERDAERPGVYEPDPADELAASELFAELEQSHREALLLTKIGGYSTAEAAACAGISADAMRARVSRALRATVELLKRERNK